jgi:hypothetical protein
MGAWWLAEELKQGVTAQVIGRFPANQAGEFFFYPDSRDGKEFRILFQMTPNMACNGEVRDNVRIELYDDRIKVWGPPVEAAIGEKNWFFDRY